MMFWYKLFNSLQTSRFLKLATALWVTCFAVSFFPCWRNWPECVYCFLSHCILNGYSMANIDWLKFYFACHWVNCISTTLLIFVGVVDMLIYELLFLNVIYRGLCLGMKYWGEKEIHAWLFTLPIWLYIMETKEEKKERRQGYFAR